MDFSEIVNLQNKLNNNTNGPDWTSGITNKGRKINWLRCIYMEAAEAIDSLNWKHWKNLNGTEDIANLKVETVDILHFLVSQFIAAHGVEQTIEILNSEYQKFRDQKFLLDFSNVTRSEQTVNVFEAMIKTSVNGKIPLSEFFQAVLIIEDFTMEEVQSLYIGKNCLNEFRQDHGYKEGSYIKVWNGSEDNVYMQNIIEDNPLISFDKLYQELESTYSTLS